MWVVIEKRRLKKIEREFESCYKKYVELNRNIVNEWFVFDFEGFLKYENIIYDDFGYDFYRIEESRVVESGESDIVKLKLIII